MQLFYFKGIHKELQTLELDKEEARHMTRSLRKKVGDQVHITDGQGNLYYGTISLVTSSKCVMDLAFAKAYSKPSPDFHIAIAPTKMNDRMEWFLEKATEMGISRITPILCDHSERKKINDERFLKIIVSAMKQSNQFYLPIIDPLTPFKDFIEEPDLGTKCIAHCEEDHKMLFSKTILPITKTTILIGPEGDFSQKEIELAVEKGFQPTSLGDNRLRTETAGIYATAVFNSVKASQK